MLSLNEIRDRALRFTKDHLEDDYERGETSKFWIDFFEVFGVDRRRLDFEKRVIIQGSQKYIDCFLAGEILVEQKSKGRDLDDAFEQARNYLRGLRDDELPQVILVSDFEKIRVYDLQNTNDFYVFSLKDFHKNIEYFEFLTGRKKEVFQKEDPVNIKASKLMGEVHDRLFEIGYKGHDLEIFLVRILFCLFAEDTGIFRLKQFENFVQNKTAEDGSDLGAKIDELFEVLNTPVSNRLQFLDEELSEFEYINGKLFAENIRKTAFNTEMRNQILRCAEFDWSGISPAIFGSLFQYVMDDKKRRDLGAHYTDEQNIKKVIEPLFLDQLWEEFRELSLLKRNKIVRLQEFHQKLANLTFLDPACGCGNFLVITYKELRKLELEVLKIILEKELKQRMLFDVKEHILLDVNQFYGIEIEEFSAKIAEVSLWLTDHLMNREVAEEFGQHFARIPLKNSANIVFGNALRTDWNEVLPVEKCSYVIGNPPFYGKSLQTKEQKEDMLLVFGNDVKKYKSLDYVSAWYKKAAEYCRGAIHRVHGEGAINGRPYENKIEVGFVSTNSICQGEQVGILWKHLMEDLGIKINFAHQTFKWNNEASGKAQVFVIIIGFALFDEKKKFLFEYEDVRGEARKKEVKNINGYLVNAIDVFLERTPQILCKDIPLMDYGNKPTDGGNLILNEKEKDELLLKNPEAEKFVKKFIGAREFLHNELRYCLWLKDCNPIEFSKIPFIKKRLEAVRNFRLSSIKKQTRALSELPTRFEFTSQPNSDYIVFPLTTSETRKYIPIGFFPQNIIVSNLISIIPNATLYHFGILTSEMHMAWTRFVCGRLEGRYRYSNSIVYNNFPWAENVSEQQEKNIEKLAQEILDIREKYQNPHPNPLPEGEGVKGASLADLYDPLTMPVDLLKAHKALDKAVEKLYRKESFENDAERVAFLFERYGEMVGRI